MIKNNKKSYCNKRKLSCFYANHTKKRIEMIFRKYYVVKIVFIKYSRNEIYYRQDKRKSGGENYGAKKKKFVQQSNICFDGNDDDIFCFAAKYLCGSINVNRGN